MKKNVGSTDKAIRIILAIVFAALVYTGRIEGVWAIVGGIVALLLVLTSFISFCPLYWPFNITTKSENKDPRSA